MLYVFVFRTRCIDLLFMHSPRALCGSRALEFGISAHLA